MEAERILSPDDGGLTPDKSAISDAPFTSGLQAPPSTDFVAPYLIYVTLAILFLTLIAYYIFFRPKSPSLFPNMASVSATAVPSSCTVSAAPHINIPGPITAAELSKANGTNGAPLYIAVKDPFSTRVVVFDVASGADFYGPGGPYNVFVARDATHGLAKSSVDPKLVSGDLDKLSATEKDTHMQWFAKYTSKYPQVGWLELDQRAKSASTSAPNAAHSVRQTEKVAQDTKPVDTTKPNGVDISAETDLNGDVKAVTDLKENADADVQGATNITEEDSQPAEAPETQSPVAASADAE